MDGVGGVPGAALRILGPKASGLVIGTGRFRPNAASAVTITAGTLKGLFTVAYGATGLFTVTFSPAAFKFPTGRLPVILAGSVSADHTNTNRFQAMVRDEWNNTTKSFVIQTTQEATAFQVPSDADNWVNFVLFGETK